MKLSSFEISEATSWRRHLHSRPEFGFEVAGTAAFVAERLKRFGLEVHNVGGGIVGLLQRGEGRRKIGLRADLDALQITELNTFEHASRNQGLMHACGHDGHTAMLLTAAKRLATLDNLDATISFIFQPAEEHGRGAQAMIDDGLFERFTIGEVYALHNLPGLPVGTFATQTGPIMAAEDNFEIELVGAGGHAALPHQTSEVLVAGCQLVTALQSIVSRRVNPLEQAVVSVTEFLTDGARNILPGRCVLKGDTRSYTAEVQTLIEQSMRRLAEGTAAAFGLTATVSYTHEFAATINSPAETAVACAAAAAAGCTVVDDFGPLMAADDFGVMLRHRPGNYALLGNGDAPGAAPLHNPRYDFNDDALQYGVGYFMALATSSGGAE